MTKFQPPFATLSRCWPRLAPILPLIATLVGAAGCTGMGYRLGSTLPPDIRSVHVPTFVNQSHEPQLEVATTRASIEEVQKNGVLKLAGEADADARLFVTLTDVVLEPLRFNRQEVKTTEEYRIRLLAKVTFVRIKSGEKLINEAKVQGQTTFDFIGDMASSKRRAIPEAAKDLAKEIVRTVQEFW